MKTTAAPKDAPERPTRVEFKVRFSQKRGKGRRPTRIRVAETLEDPETAVSGDAGTTKAPEPSQVPKLTRLLVLGHHFERLVRDGVVKDYAEIARLTGLSRARVTQISNLTLLSPKLQEQILLPGQSRTGVITLSERELRVLPSTSTWAD